jgi:hypothetical protein
MDGGALLEYLPRCRRGDFMRILALAVALSLSALADEKPVDKANAQLEASRKSVRAGAKKLESDTNRTLEVARKKGKKAARQLEKEANEAARSLRQKLGTEK